MARPMLEVSDLTIEYDTPTGPITAVSGVSFSIDEGEYFGLVGESGCGKSTIVDAILGILDSNGSVIDGRIVYNGEEIQQYSNERLNQEIRWKEIAWIPQGSMNSLDPTQRIDKKVLELAHLHTDLSSEEAIRKFKSLLDIVGIQGDRIYSYPHQLSGGMKQRTIIALALFLDSSLIIADEPTTALDVITQDQILKYIDQVKEDLEVSMLLITHDISLVFESCEHMAIMHSGQIAEHGPVYDVYESPYHPYSIALQDSLPDYRFPDKDLAEIDGDPPQLRGEVDYCTFVDRCPYAVAACHEETPPMEQVSQDHFVACYQKAEAHRQYQRRNYASGEGSNR